MFDHQDAQQANALGSPDVELWAQKVAFSWADSSTHFSITIKLLYLFKKENLAVAVGNFRSHAIPWHCFPVSQTALLIV